MGSQYKSSVTWGHTTTQSEEKRDEVVKLAKAVANFEQKQDGCGFYIVIAPTEGEQPTEGQDTRLEIILNHEDESYLENTHRNSDAYKRFQDASDQKELLKKPPSTMTFTPKTGFLHRDKVPSEVPLNEQFVWIAKLDCHEGKINEFLEAIRVHTANVERTEDGTLSFLALQSGDKGESVTLFERYTSEKYFNDVHAKSESMQQFRSKIQPLLAERVSAGFRPVAGFVDKREVLA